MNIEARGGGGSRNDGKEILPLPQHVEKRDSVFDVLLARSSI